jgi:Protein of unknown function (DUF1445)
VYRTDIPTVAAGPFAGPLVVSMRPLKAADAIRAVQITSRYPVVHGAPVHLGDAAQIGIAGLARPDHGDVDARWRHIRHHNARRWRLRREDRFSVAGVVCGAGGGRAGPQRARPAARRTARAAAERRLGCAPRLTSPFRTRHRAPRLAAARTGAQSARRAVV